MTDAELLAFADDYFSGHLDAAYWTALSAEQKSAALTQARQDVFAEVSNCRARDFDETSYAVCEQAVYLLRTYETQAAGRVVQSQSLGQLSQSFQYLGGSSGDLTLAPRAVRFLRAAKKKIPRRVEFSRG